MRHSLTPQEREDTRQVLTACAVILGFCGFVLFCVIFWVGFNKALDIKERTVYDKETGRMVYLEEGV